MDVVTLMSRLALPEAPGVRTRAKFRLGQVLGEAPASLLMLTLTVTVSVGSAWGGEPRSLMQRLTAYHGTDLGQGRLWRLVLSAFAAQDALQFVWTILMLVTVFVAAERRVGSLGLLLIAGACHVLSTLTIDALAYIEGWQSWLTRADFGTSCLIMGTIMMLVLATRSRTLALLLLVMVLGDGFVNMAMTVLEHLVAVAVAVTGYALLSRAKRRHPNMARRDG